MRSDIKKRINNRLKIVGGQIRGLEKMVEEEVYCPNIIMQSSAIREALSAIEDLMLENHLSTHVAAQLRGKNSKRAMDEVLRIYKLGKKR